MAYEGSFVRWQSIAIDQMGYSIGLILSFASASLGFAFSVIRSQDYRPSCWGKAFMLASLICLTGSLGLGLWCVINRLRDFRKTRGIARRREMWEREGASKIDIDGRLGPLRDETRKLGERTWSAFWWQIGTFAVGAAMLLFALGLSYHSKLF